MKPRRSRSQIHEEREAFIATYRICSVTGRLYGPDELTRSVARFLGLLFVPEPYRTARRWVNDPQFMKRQTGSTPPAVANAVWSQYLRGER